MAPTDLLNCEFKNKQINAQPEIGSYDNQPSRCIFSSHRLSTLPIIDLTKRLHTIISFFVGPITALCLFRLVTTPLQLQVLLNCSKTSYYSFAYFLHSINIYHLFFIALQGPETVSLQASPLCLFVFTANLMQACCNLAKELAKCISCYKVLVEYLR